MNFLFGAFAVVGMIFMATFMFLGIWLFIIALKAFRQLKYKNYILEKIYQKISLLSDKSSEEILDDDFFDLEKTDYDNVKNFEKNSI